LSLNIKYIKVAYYKKPFDDMFRKGYTMRFSRETITEALQVISQTIHNLF